MVSAVTSKRTHWSPTFDWTHSEGDIFPVSRAGRVTQETHLTQDSAGSLTPFCPQIFAMSEQLTHEYLRAVVGRACLAVKEPPKTESSSKKAQTKEKHDDGAFFQTNVTTKATKPRGQAAWQNDTGKRTIPDRQTEISTDRKNTSKSVARNLLLNSESLWCPSKLTC